MSEARNQHEQPDMHAEMQQDVALLEQTIALAEQMDETGSVDTAVRDALVQVASQQIENDPYVSGGTTIQGTDEVIGAQRHDRYSYNRADDEGKKVSMSISAELGKRLEAYAAKHREAVKKDQEQAKTTAKATKSTAKKPKTTKVAPKNGGNKRLGVTHKRDAIGDLIELDASGRARYHNGAVEYVRDENGDVVYGDDEEAVTRRIGSRFMTKKELDLIEYHQELIRNGLADLALENAGVEPPENTSADRDATDSDPEPAAPTDGGTPVDNHEMTHDEFMDGQFMRQLPIEMAQDLAIAMNDYMRLSAMRSRATGKGGKTSLTARYVEGANGEQVTERYEGTRATAENVGFARKRYERIRRRVKRWTEEKMVEKGVAERDKKIVSYLEDKTEIELLGLGIQFDQERLSDPKGFAANSRKRFYNWWARQGSGKFFSWGTAKKAGAMAAIGLPVGIAAGAAGLFVAGPLAGGVAAAAVARGVSRGLLRGHVDKQANAKTEAARQRQQNQEAQLDRLDDAYANGDDALWVTGEFKNGTEANVRRNRRRLMGSVAIGAAAGLGGAFAGEALHHAFSGGQPEDANNGGKQPEDKKPGKKPGGRRPEHGRTGQGFRVEQGSGIIREIDQYAASHNYQGVTPQEATDIYNRLHAQFGTNIVDLQGSGPDTYMVGSDVRLAHPGMAHWGPGVEAALRAELRKAS